MNSHVAALLIVIGEVAFAQPDGACDKARFQTLVENSVNSGSIVSSCLAYLQSPGLDRKAVLAWTVGLGRAQLAKNLFELWGHPKPDELDGLLFDALGAGSDPEEMVKVLISEGANVEWAQEKFDLLYHTIELGQFKTRRLILDRLPDKTVLYDPRHLSAAVSAGDVDLIRAIVRRHGNVDFVENEGDGVTPLMFAVDISAKDAVLEVLIRMGADCERVDRMGHSAITRSKSVRVTGVLKRECHRPW
jgi:hypothetical protein